MAIQLAELAVRYGCELHGNPDTLISQVGGLETAVEGSISFLANSSYRKYLAGTAASAVILREALVPECPAACLVADDPYLVYARVAADLHPLPSPVAGIHPTAVVGEGTRIPDSCEIAAGVVLGNNVKLGERVYIGPNSVLGDDAEIGADTRLAALVSVCNGVRIGERCLFHSGVVIGADGFGIAQSPEGWVKVPQVGAVVIGNDVELGANTTVDRGAIDDTVLGNGVKLDNLVQIGHNAIIGDHTVMASQAGISGSTRVGARCVIGGKVGVAGHLEIAEDSVILGGASVTKSISNPGGMYSSVIPAEEARKWRRIAGRLKRLDDMVRRLKDVETRLEKKDKGSN